MRCVLEQTLMLAQSRHEPGFIGRIARSDHLPSNNQAAIHFGVVDLVTELGVVRWGFAPTDDLCVRLNETHDFVSGWDAFTFQHPPFRLCNHLLDQRDHFIELLPQALSRCRRRFAQCFGHRTTLGHRDAGNRPKFRIRLIYGFFLTAPRFELRRRAWLARDQRAIRCIRRRALRLWLWQSCASAERAGNNGRARFSHRLNRRTPS